MKRLLSLALVALLCLALPGSAEQGADAGGLPGSDAAQEADRSLSGSVIVQVRADGAWLDLPSTMRYAHERGRIADGVLAFLPLDVFFLSQEIDIPVLPLTEDFSWRLLRDDYPDEVVARLSLLQYDGERFVAVDAGELPGAGLPFSGLHLPDGVYLLRLDHQATRAQDAYAASAFVWLRVGASDAPVPFARASASPAVVPTQTPMPQQTP